MYEPTYVEGTLPSSGDRFRIWIGGDGRWAVIEAHDVVSFAPAPWKAIGGVPAHLVADRAVDSGKRASRDRPRSAL